MREVQTHGWVYAIEVAACLRLEYGYVDFLSSGKNLYARICGITVRRVIYVKQKQTRIHNL